MCFGRSPAGGRVARQPRRVAPDTHRGFVGAKRARLERRQATRDIGELMCTPCSLVNEREPVNRMLRARLAQPQQDIGAVREELERKDVVHVGNRLRRPQQLLCLVDPRELERSLRSGELGGGAPLRTRCSLGDVQPACERTLVARELGGVRTSSFASVCAPPEHARASSQNGEPSARCQSSAA